MIIKDNRGNKAEVQENGLMDITPKGKSTLFFNLEEIIEVLIQTGKYECWKEENK